MVGLSSVATLVSSAGTVRTAPRAFSKLQRSISMICALVAALLRRPVDVVGDDPMMSRVW
jgi:hypothetical protein